MKNNLEKIRKSRGMSREELADALGVSRQIISSLENGRYNPSILLAFKISRLFDMHIEDIFIYEDESNHVSSESEQKKNDLHKKWRSKN